MYTGVPEPDHSWKPTSRRDNDNLYWNKIRKITGIFHWWMRGIRWSILLNTERGIKEKLQRKSWCLSIMEIIVEKPTRKQNTLRFEALPGTADSSRIELLSALLSGNQSAWHRARTSQSGAISPRLRSARRASHPKRIHLISACCIAICERCKSSRVSLCQRLQSLVTRFKWRGKYRFLWKNKGNNNQLVWSP